MYLGDLAHTSFQSDEVRLNNRNAAQLRALWKLDAGATLSTGVTVSNGFLYFGAWDGNFFSVEAATGRVVWKQNLGVAPNPSDSSCQPGIGVAAQPVVADGKVYAAGGDSAIWALDAATGVVLWRTPLADPQSGSQLWASLMLSGNALYAGIASLGDCPLVRGGLARIPLDHPASPVIRYFVPEGATGAGIWTTPAIDEQMGTIYVTTGNADSQDAAGGVWGSAILELDAATLNVRGWFFLPIVAGEQDVDFGSSPLLFQTPDGGRFVAANGKDGVMYVARRPGLALAWKMKLATDCVSPEDGCGSISTPAFDGNTIFAGAGQGDEEAAGPGAVYAVDPAGSATRWMYKTAGVVLAPVTVTPTLVLVPTTAGLAALDATTGSELWNDGTGKPMYGQAAVSGGVVYAPYATGELIAWGLPDGVTPSLVPAPAALNFSATVGVAATPLTLDVFSSDAPLGFAVSTDKPWLAAVAASASTPAKVTVTVDASGLQPGAYSGRVLLQAAGGGAAIAVPVTLSLQPPIAALSAAGVVNAASMRGGPLSPGGLFTVFAPGLAAEAVTAPYAPWPASLAGLSVEINGLPAPIYYAGPGQINAQAPYELAPGDATLVVRSNGASSAPVPVSVQAAAPGIFTIGAGRAAAQNQGGALNTAANPAAPGDAVTIYFTGQGLCDYPLLSGAATPYEYLVNTFLPVTATIGGQPADVMFAGLTPRSVGLAQANLLVPQLAPGDYDVVLTINGVQSNAAVVSVGSAP